MKHIKRHHRVIIIVLILGTAVSVLPFWSDIDITLHGIQARNGDMEYTEEKAVTIRGRYWRYLFRSNRFEGRIEIEGYAVTFSDLIFPISFAFPDSTLTYWCRFGRFQMESFGRISAAPGFSKVFIAVWEPREANSMGWHSGDGLFISAPATSREQAIDIARELHGHWRFPWE